MNTFQKEMLKKGKSISLTLLSLLVFIACEKEAKPGMGGGPGKGKDMPPSVVDYTIATGQELTRTILATGNLLANETVEIRPERAGRLEKIYFKEGGQVVKGALLAELDRDDLEAQLAKLKVNEQFAERELKRAKSLLDIEGITQEEYDRLSTNLNLVKADIRVTEVGIEKTKIFAPFTGKVGLRQLSEGAFVSNADRLVSLQQTNPIKLEFDVPEREARDLKTGQQITFTVEGLKQVFNATVYALSSVINQNTRTLTVRATCPNGNGLLQPGNFARVSLVTSKIQNSILVPTDAIIPVLEGQQLFLIKGGKVLPALVETGSRKNNNIAVTSGISIGDTILLSGLLAVKPGDMVIPGNFIDLVKMDK
ncbi:MAG: efflux RND transporter periplasmic adaptor subunit [Bacteroidetes bacterium]|nr:efflux RND transporter periplasmic adaptor subunit [Bacteroidota bacterium]